MNLNLPNLYEYTSYKDFLVEVVSKNRSMRAVHQVLAEKLKCHRTLLSRVLKGEDHISIESGMNFCESQNFSTKDTQYFLRILLYARTEQKNLREFLRKEVDELRKSRIQVKERIVEKGSVLSYAQETYYRSWIPSAIHVLTSVTEPLTTRHMAERLHLNEEIVEEVLRQLEQNSLVTKEKGRWTYAGSSIHLGKESPYYLSFYQAWSDRALAALVNRDKAEENIHFTGIVSISKKTEEQIKEILLRSLEDVKNCIEKSPDEDDIACLKVDFFRP